MVTYPAITMEDLPIQSGDAANLRKPRVFITEDTAATVINNRIQAENERKNKRELDFWNEIGKHVHIKSDIGVRDLDIDTDELKDIQFISKPSDIKIGFKRG